MRRQQLEEMLLRVRGSANAPRPSRLGNLVKVLLDWFMTLWQRAMHPLRALGRRARVRTQAVQDFAVPLAAGAESIHRRQRIRSRWWDPLALWLRRYADTRSRRNLLRGLPALLTLAACVAVAITVSGARPAATRYTDLLAAAELAMSNRDYPKALIAYERMVQVGYADAAMQFSLARCLAAMGDSRRAAQLLCALAPDDQTGYLPAHRVRAFAIMQSPNATPDDLALARRHLDRVLAVNPDDDEAHGLLASLLLRQNKLREARDHFVQSADGRPDMALNAALLSRALGDAAAVADNAAIAVVYYQDELKKADKHVAATTVLSLAQALCLQHKYREAVATLQSCLEKADRQPLIDGIVQICDVWQREIELRQSPEDLDRLFITQSVLTVQPQSHVWQLRLLDLASGKSLVRPAALKLIEQLAQDQNAGAEVCFFLGMEALRHDDHAAGRAYLERSYKLLPDHEATAINLACTLLEGPDPDPARALALATQALKTKPDNPLFRETRGEALAALARWPEAVDELEAALPRLEDRRQAHLQLASAYEKLGQNDKAQQHRMLALTDKRASTH